MGKVGRPARYKTEEAKEEAKTRLEKQRNRLDSLMKKNNLSGKRAGEIISVSDKAISQYRNGRVELSFESARLLAPFLGTYPEYLIGQADEETEAEYLAACEMIAVDIVDEEAESMNALISQRKALFNSLGYEYLCRGMAAVDFLAAVPGTEAPTWAHMVKPLDGPGHPTYFSDAELEDLVSGLQDLVAFRCFQQQSRNRR